MDISMIAIILSSILAPLLMLGLYIYVSTLKMAKLSEKIPGPKTLPIVGNAFDLTSFKPSTYEFFQNVIRIGKQYKSIFRIWLATDLYIAVTDEKISEAILGSNKILQKSIFYDNFFPWLGTGLLTSTGEKWRKHRKILTPTFHFKILEEFIDVFNSMGSKMITKLKAHAGGEEFDLYPYIRLCTLDIICETAMGISLNLQDNPDCEYVKAIHMIADAVIIRSLRPWLKSDFVFQFTSTEKLQRKALKVLHNMTREVIKMKKKEYEQRRKSINNEEESTTDDFGIKRRKAFLDLLIEEVEDKNSMSDEDLANEVDTFMFEGHDTTTSAISFALSSLALNPDIQDKAYAEQVSIFGSSDRDATYSDLQDMKYLEMVIKETLRLYPSVPIFGRKLLDDVKVEDYIFPKGSNVLLFPFMMHRDPKLFTDPEKFNPERFTMQNIENLKNKNPYQYVPFSAGPRNCIGQKFAMLEMKSTVSKFIRNYKLIAGSTTNKYEELNNELILKNINGNRLRLLSRQRSFS